MGVLIFLLVLGGLGYGIVKVQTNYNKFPTNAQISAEVEKEKLLCVGMHEINRYLAPYQTPDDDTRMDVGCTFCDSMRQDVTQHEIDAEGWTYVNGATRCPDCSTGKEKPVDKLAKPNEYPYWCQSCLTWTQIKHMHERCDICEAIDCKCWPGDNG